jgi:gas vesicle protein
MSKPERVGIFISGVMLGSAAGTILGLLIAPRTGRETRKVLQKSADALPQLAEDLATSVQLQADRLSENTLHNWEGTLAKLRQAIAAGVTASQLEIQKVENRTKSGKLNSSTLDRS